MRRKGENQNGWTLIELLLVLSILGVIAVSAIPKFLDVFAKSKEASMEGVVGAVRTGISLYKAYDMTTSGGHTGNFPATLDSAAVAPCSKSNPCFTTVMLNGVDDPKWIKTGDTTYTCDSGPGLITYTYTPETGIFSK